MPTLSKPGDISKPNCQNHYFQNRWVLISDLGFKESREASDDYLKLFDPIPTSAGPSFPRPPPSPTTLALQSAKRGAVTTPRAADAAAGVEIELMERGEIVRPKRDVDPAKEQYLDDYMDTLDLPAVDSKLARHDQHDQNCGGRCGSCGCFPCCSSKQFNDPYSPGRSGCFSRCGRGNCWQDFPCCFRNCCGGQDDGDEYEREERREQRRPELAREAEERRKDLEETAAIKSRWTDNDPTEVNYQLVAFGPCEDFITQIQRQHQRRTITHIDERKLENWIIIPRQSEKEVSRETDDDVIKPGVNAPSGIWKDTRGNGCTPDVLDEINKAKKVTLLYEGSFQGCCGLCKTRAKGRYSDQSFAIGPTEMWNCVTCQCTLKRMCWKSCCCGCDALAWLCGVNKWIIITGVFLFFAGFVALCVHDQEWGMFVADIIMGFFNFLTTPVGSSLLVFAILSIVVKAMADWVRKNVSMETLRQWANKLQNLPLPVKVIGGVIAAAGLAALVHENFIKNVFGHCEM